jgi:hypothetical protein
MALTPFTYDDYYVLEPHQDPNITMDFILGSPGQSADYTVQLDSTVLYNHQKTSLKDVNLGTPATLKDKILTVVGILTDMSGTDNNLTLDLKVTGGKAPLDVPYSVVATTGDTLPYSYTVRFY